MWSSDYGTFAGPKPEGVKYCFPNRYTVKSAARLIDGEMPEVNGADGKWEKGKKRHVRYAHVFFVAGYRVNTKRGLPDRVGRHAVREGAEVLSGGVEDA